MATFLKLPPELRNEIYELVALQNPNISIKTQLENGKLERPLRATTALIAANKQIHSEYYAVLHKIAFTAPRVQLSVKISDFDFQGLINFIESCNSTELASMTSGPKVNPIGIEIKASPPVNVNIHSLRQWLELQNSTRVAVDYKPTDLGDQPERVRSSIYGLYGRLFLTRLRSEMGRIRWAVQNS